MMSIRPVSSILEAVEKYDQGDFVSIQHKSNCLKKNVCQMLAAAAAGLRILMTLA